MKPYLYALWLLASIISQSAFCATQYLPNAIDPGLESDLQRLVTLGELAGVKRPYSLKMVQQALKNIKEAHPALYRRLKQSLRNYDKRFAITQVNLAAYQSEQDASPLPNAMGASTEERYSFGVTAHYQPIDALAVTIAGESSNERSTPAGSLVSLGGPWLQMDIGYKAYWFSPFQGSSQLLSTHAEPMPAIGISNYRPLEIWGTKWSYELFTAQMGRQPTLFNNQFSDRKGPLLTGVHVAFHPVDWWTLSVTRMLQYGGGERPIKLSTFLRAFWDPKNGDNEASVDEESGNQVGAIASQMHFDGVMPFTFSIELAAEDTSDFKVYRPGNPALTAGLYFPYFFTKKVAFNVEYASWDNAWYVNNVYQEGYSNEDFVLGHWAMQDQYRGGTATPGDSYFAFLQWMIASRHTLDLSARYANHDGNFAPGEAYNSAWQLEAEYRWRHKSLTYGVGAHIGTDSFGEDFNQFRFRVQWR